MRFKKVVAKVMASAAIAITLGSGLMVSPLFAQCAASPIPDYQWDCEASEAPVAATSSKEVVAPIPDFRWTGKDFVDTGKPVGSSTSASDTIVRTIKGQPRG